MATNDDEFTSTLKEWLKDRAILADTRKFLQTTQHSARTGGITDGQLANWRRRECLPNTFLEGAALYHCAQARNLEPTEATKSPSGSPIEGDEFWQVFVVHAPKVEKQPMLDCTILRCWQGMRARHRGTGWFAHPAHRSIGNLSARDNDEKPKIDPLVEDGSFADSPPQPDGTVVASWEVSHEESRDQGYHAKFPNSIANDQKDAVGGCPIIPVASSHLLAYLPQSLVHRQREMMDPDNPRGIPIAFSVFLHGGNPAHIMESYLGVRGRPPTEETFRRVATWFKAGPPVEEWQHDTHRVPELIRQHNDFQEAEKLLHEGKYEAYATHDYDPRSFLSHFMTFGPRLTLDKGASNG